MQRLLWLALLLWPLPAAAQTFNWPQCQLSCQGTPLVLPSATPSATLTATATATATATPTATPSPLALTLTAPQSTMLRCQEQTGPNAAAQALAPGQTTTVGCLNAAPVNLNAHATILVNCGNAPANQSWTPLTAGQSANIVCAPGPSATPTAATPTPLATGSASPLPTGVPSPPPIPPIPALNHPLTLAPGAVFGGVTVKGDGQSDDTAAIQNALNQSDVIVAPATYAIAGNVSIPTGRNIACQSGATFFDPQSKGTRMLGIGFNAGSLGHNSIVGCTIAGTDFVAGDPSSYANYQGGTAGYSETLQIASGWGLHTDHVLLENLTVKNTQGDGILTYSPCGTNKTGAACNGGAPGTEGPSNIWIVNTNISHCGQPGIHVNGGQNIVVTGTHSVDCANDQEADANVLQHDTSWWYDNFFGVKDGGFDPLDGKIHAPFAGCTGHLQIGSDDSGCWFFDNTVDGRIADGPNEIWQQVCPNGVPGHYVNNRATNGATLRGSC